MLNGKLIPLISPSLPVNLSPGNTLYLLGPFTGENYESVSHCIQLAMLAVFMSAG